MKEYVIAASQIVSGYFRMDRYRTEVYNNQTGETTYSGWTTNYSTHIDQSSNRIKREFSSSRTLTDANPSHTIYKNQQIIDYYRIDITFDVSNVPVNRIQSVALRAKLTGKNDKTPRGYLISSSSSRFYPITQLGDCDLGTPETMPYTHDTVLSALS